MSDSARDRLRRKVAALRSEAGGWTAHNIRLAEGVFTVGEAPNYDNVKLNRVVQTIAAFAGKPWNALRILDLASQDGMYAIECALQGAEAVGIEIREAHVRRADFAREVLGLDRVTFRRGDARDVSRERDGVFDVVLLLGLLYHLTPTDSARLLKAVSEMCTDLLIVDTHLSLEAVEVAEWGGKAYEGRWVLEHPARSSPAAKEARLWQSWDNERAFLFSEESLVRLLRDSGFRVVVKVLAPLEKAKPNDRVTLVALKREARPLRAFPDASPEELEESPVAPSMPPGSVRPSIAGRVVRRIRSIWRSAVGGMRT